MHSLRGGASTVSLHSVAAGAAEVEQALAAWSSTEPSSQQALVSAAHRFLELVRIFAVGGTDSTGGSGVRMPPEEDGPVVLHIEDNLSNLKLVERVLALRPEIRLAEAETGSAGLALAQVLLPDLILLDLRLPDLSGDEVLRRVREGEATREIPVILISAEARPAEVDRLLAGGADEFLVKPIDIATLLGVVDRILVKAQP